MQEDFNDKEIAGSFAITINLYLLVALILVLVTAKVVGWLFFIPWWLIIVSPILGLILYSALGITFLMLRHAIFGTKQKGE